MKEKLQSLFNCLSKNRTNYVCYYCEGIRKTRYYYQLSQDIDTYINRLRNLSLAGNVQNVAIIGPTSYEWMVIDLACIKGGFKSVAIPEELPLNEIKKLIDDEDVDIILADYCLKKKIVSMSHKTYYYRCGASYIDNNFDILPEHSSQIGNTKILDEYGIAYSSGTTKNPKRISLTSRAQKIKRRGWALEILNNLIKYCEYKRSFWSRKDNRIIIMMPFSHVQQRMVVFNALLSSINIILSDPLNCIKHIIIEKPNIIVSVPILYEILAIRIKEKIHKFNSLQKSLMKLFNYLKINGYSNRNLIKRLFTYILFKDIQKIYGGRADYFVTGSAPIDPYTLRIFYSIGVKIFEGYGLSETEVIAINTHKQFKIGSVGKPQVEIKIDQDSEVLLKYDDERHNHNREILNIDEEGYIHTGDLGYLDRQGYLFLLGRKDDVIVLSNGKKVFPTKIENMIRKSTIVKHAIAFGIDDKVHMILDCGNRLDNKTRSQNQDTLKQEIEKINIQLADYERIEGFCISRRPFTVQNGLLTRTFKPRRNAIIDKYRKCNFINCIAS